MIYVIGSGPAGVSCTAALLSNGEKVTILDAGITLEEEYEMKLDELKKKEELSEYSLVEWKNTLSKKMVCKKKGDLIKFVHGSDFPFKDVSKHINFSTKNVTMCPSFAKGGLSNVWGASVMPYKKEELEDWPISMDEIEPHYKNVLQFMKISTNKDSLSKLFPLYTDQYYTFNYSGQAKKLIEVFSKNKSSLESNGIFFGSSRLAFQAEDKKDKKGCVYCGLCLYGCPHDLIYSSTHTLNQLQKNKNFHYIDKVVVDFVKEIENGVVISAHNLITGKKSSFQASRVFLACGALQTTNMLLRSMRAYEEKIFIKDSLRIVIPFFTYFGARNVSKEKLHTLAQIYLEIFDKKIDPNSIHVQFYTYNDLYEANLKKNLGSFMYKLFKNPIRWMCERMVCAFCYLHSNSSHGMVAVLKKNNKDKLEISKVKNNKTSGEIFKLVMKFIKNRKKLKMFPIFPLIKIDNPGGGNHYGGSFPMSKNPQKFQSDSLGRPYGFKKVHIVDSTIFPTFPAQNSTLTIMANAYRIGSNYGSVIK